MMVALGLAIDLPYRLRDSLPVKTLNTDGIHAVQAGLLTLSAFVLGLSFSQASARFDGRRAVVVDLANAIGTTWLRADQLAPAQSARFRRVLVDDTEAGLRVYEGPADPELSRQTIERADRDQAELWRIASSALQGRETNLGLSLLMQSLNNLIDVVSEQRQRLAGHVPTAIVVLTLCLVMLGTLSLGIRFAVDASRPIVLSVIYVLAYVIVIEMMIDYDRPNTGFVTVNLTPLTEQLQFMQQQH